MVRFLKNGFFPKHCPICEELLDEGCDWLIACDLCSAHWPDLRGPSGSVFMKERCFVEYAQTGFRLRTEKRLNQQVNEFKYGGNRFLARRWGQWLGTHHSLPKEYQPNRCVLVPVPLHWKKRVIRGYNQAHWIAKGISSVWKIPVHSSLLHRRHHGKSLTNLDRKSRNELSRELYESNHANGRFQVFLVDDVMTTGSTLSACGYAVQRAGHEWIGIITLALA